MSLATIAGGKTAASCGEGKRNCKTRPEYHGVRNFHLINSKKLQIGIGIGRFSIINAEELHIGNLWVQIPEGGIGIGIGKRK